MLTIERFPAIYRTFNQSQLALGQATELFRSIDCDAMDYICVYIVGSYGRQEADASVSDLEWLLVYEENRVSRQEADLFQTKVAASLASVVGRERLSIGKTFGSLCRVCDLRSNIGGIADSNQMLTYRMLVLGEGVPVLRNHAYFSVLASMAQAYGGSHTAGHRLLSLATDICRYWRTLRIDYKFKVDEERKPWAVRNLKLRSCRRFWFLSQALHFVACGPRIEYARDEMFDISTIQEFMSSMNGSSAKRMIDAVEKLAGDQDVLKAVLSKYDSILANLCCQETRVHLDALCYQDRHKDSKYQELRTSCLELHDLMAQLVITLPHWSRLQMIEMFLL